MPADSRSNTRIKTGSLGGGRPAAVSSADRAGEFRERVRKLFADFQKLSADPACADPGIGVQLEALRARLLALEAQISDSRESPPPSAADVRPSPAATVPVLPARPLVYEPDQIGFVYSKGRLQEVRSVGTPADLPPVIAAPLSASGQLIGAVQLAPPAERALTDDEAGILNAVAQQASLQIQSLRLLAETQRSRAEAEAATRRFMHESWSSYLDAIHQNERVGYAYDQFSVIPFIEKPEAEFSIHETVSVLEEQVGGLYLKPDPAHPLVEGDKELVASVAHQIAQQVENIRLLADASRARAEADEVIKRMTRESWESFVVQKGEEESLGFAYDTNQVTSFSDEMPLNVALSLPLQVHGETVGQLVVTGPEQVAPEAADLAAAIAAQTSTHLETLRLNEELQKRAAELLELDRLKSGFLANMSHELRTPLNSILGFSDVILEGLDGPLTPNMGADLGLIQKNGQHLLHLINDVLDMAKIEAGRMNLDPEKMRVHEILDEVTSITSTLASERNLALFIEPESDQIVEIVADRTRIRQVMINLVNNAIKFTGKGQIAIRVVKTGDAHVLITVRDTGIGIPADKLELIFQEFTQVDTSSTRKAGGTGLGLPISRRLVEMHGGRLWVESAGVSGQGSTFYVELPTIAQVTEVVVRKERQR
jgi:signal transduction histidine kinase